LLCPLAREGELADAITAARAVADGFNLGADGAHVDVYVLVGRIAQDDAEAGRAIAAEIRELLETMRAAIREADPDAIREAANKARALGQMLDASVAGKVTDAIREARSVARQIVKSLAEAGEVATKATYEAYTLGRLEEARFAFLDLSEGEATETLAPAGRAVDVEPEPVTTPTWNPDPVAMAAADTPRSLEL
jgi:hypothetical protein